MNVCDAVVAGYQPATMVISRVISLDEIRRSGRMNIGIYAFVSILCCTDLGVQFLVNYLILLAVSVFGWILDAVLQAVFYFSVSPFGGSMVAEGAGQLFASSLFHSANEFTLFLLPLFLLLFLNRRLNKKQEEKGIPGWLFGFHAVLVMLLICLNHADHEIFRFMGARYSLDHLKSYNVFSSTTGFAGGTLREDARGAYSSLILAVIPVMFLASLLIFKKKIINVASRLEQKFSKKHQIISFAAICLLVGVMVSSSAMDCFCLDDGGLKWKPARYTLRTSPILVTFINDYVNQQRVNDSINNNAESIHNDVLNYQKLWLAEETDKNWKFVSDQLPLQKTYQGDCRHRYEAEKPNIVVIYMESARAVNLPDFNHNVKNDPMPFLHSLITGEQEIMKKHQMKSSWYNHYYAAGLPTVDALMSTHIGIPAHSRNTVASTYAGNAYPSYVSMLRDYGYHTTFISSSDGGFTNWRKWCENWYDQFVDLLTFDDRVTISRLGDHILERRNINQPFMVSALTISNHIPFQVPDGGIQPEKNTLMRDRMNYTLRYCDDQLKALFEKLDANDALSNTIFVLLADHGYSLNDVPNPEMLGENFDTLRNNVLWVPMIIVSDIPNMPQGLQTQIASHADLAPTVLDAAGICSDNSFVGHSLLAPSHHHILVNKNNNFMFADKDFMGIFVNEARSQLFQSDDLGQEHDVWLKYPDTVENMAVQGASYRRVIDYAYDRNLIPPIAK